MKHTIVLVETRENCSFCERTSRYNVLFNGKKVGQLYFNLRGYIGSLPTPNGHNLIIGEKPISAYRKEANKLNKEFELQKK